MLLSGLRATVLMNDEAVLDEEKVKAALKEKGMGFVSLEHKEQPIPKASYILAVSGAG